MNLIALTSMMYEMTEAGGFARLFVAAALIVVLAAMILVGRAYDLSWKREAQAASLETRISRSLRADPSLSPFPIVPTVRIPLWRGSPVIIAMTGSVPRSQIRLAAVELALREAGKESQDVSRRRRDFGGSNHRPTRGIA
jgi:hypothetical protein